MSGTSRAGRASKDKMTKTQQNQNTKIEGPPSAASKTQPTAEQMRMAHIISDRADQGDPQLVQKINQVMELTGKSYDDASVALYDCDNDPNKAVNLLLEQNDQGEWQETGKKKKRGNQQSSGSKSTENNLTVEGGKGDRIDKREKSRERDRDHERNEESTERSERYSGRGNRPERPPRLSRGGGGRNNWRNRENDENENNRSDSKSRERGGRGRGRGQMNGPGRGRGRGGRGPGFGGRNRGGFDKGPQIDTWTNETAENAEKSGSNWGDTFGTEDWAADEWTGSLEESKVFTPSSAPESQVFAAPTLPDDNDASLFSAPSMSVETAVFTASSIAMTTPIASTNGNSKLNDGLNSSPPPTFGQRLDLGVLLPPKPSSDTNVAPLASATLSQPSYMSNYAKQGTESIKNALGIGTSPSQASVSASTMLQSNNQTIGQSQRQTQSPANTQSTIQQQALQQRPKARTKLPPPSKIPASAVEMPGHSSFASLDVQFGNWDPSSETFGSDSAGFSFGVSSNEASSVTGSFASTSVSTTTTMSNHMSLNQSTTDASPVITASSVMSNVTTSSISNLDSITQATSPARNTVYQTTSSTPPSKQYDSSMQQNKITPPDPIPFPTQNERKSSPHFNSQRTNQTGSLGSNKSGSSPQMPYNQPGYSSNYQSNTYQSHKTNNLTSPYQQHSSGLSSHNLPTTLASQHNSQYGSHQNYQSSSSSSSSYPSQSAFSNQSGGQSSLYQTNQQNTYSAQTGSSPSSFQSSSTSSYTSQSGPSNFQSQSSSYQSPSVASGTYQNQSGNTGSYQSQTGSSTYQGQSPASGNSYPNQSSTGYLSRDSQSSSSFQAGGNQTTSSYQSGASQSTTAYQHQTTVTQSTPTSYQPTVSQSQASYQQQPTAATGGQSSNTYHQPSVTQSSSSSYPRDSQTSQSSYSHQGYASGHQTSPMTPGKLSDSLSKMNVKENSGNNTNIEAHQSSTQHSFENTNSTSSASLSTTTTTTSSSLATGAVSSSLDVPASSSTTTSSSATAASIKSTLLQSMTGKAPPGNLPPGVPPLLGPNYIMGQHGMPYYHNLAAQQPMYSYEDLQLLQRLPMPGYYDMPFQPPTTLTTRDQTGALTNVPYSGADGKLNRVDAQSPVQSQTSQQPQTPTAAHQQAFINPTIPPGYGYYYTQGMPLGGFQYTTPMFPIPPVTNAAHAGTTANAQFQKPSYGSHYGSAYDDLSQTQDFTKTAYGGATATQAKGSTGSSIGANTSATDISGTGYGKHGQSFDKQGFHAGTPPPFNLPLPTGTQAGPMGGHTAPYAPYVHPMIHQQQMLHHSLQQDTAGGTSRASQQSSVQAKGASNKAYSTAYWAAS